MIRDENTQVLRIHQDNNILNLYKALISYYLLSHFNHLHYLQLVTFSYPNSKDTFLNPILFCPFDTLIISPRTEFRIHSAFYSPVWFSTRHRILIFYCDIILLNIRERSNSRACMSAGMEQGQRTLINVWGHDPCLLTTWEMFYKSPSIHIFPHFVIVQILFSDYFAFFPISK